MQKTFCDGCGSEINAERPQASSVTLSGEISGSPIAIEVVTLREDGSIPDICWRCVSEVLDDYGLYRKSPFDEPGEEEPMAVPPEPAVAADEQAL